ncbi:uncharacterized protein FOMMEDRAFT_152870 [Fomitiporia mediterranea MF3/22]|uniref:uncharacterized protein n=1 Tax=Fomitiporia mediterranea (strain MF3/22) TaxID=694068 RepID=UPI0004409C44|nr:uncharacterized protein FOMMEDRAFT_152870 [Fomitiporia mediterranea MF3/22]EJD05545.1 hypothetical protein FOMMEDRAFT_152870 [Fomitiporia mediterranea MF3/22]
MCLPTSPSPPHLPPELWARVFFWATFSSARDVSSLLTVPLFDGIAHREDDFQVRQALVTKLTLALVCRQWRALSEQYLYEDIWVRHGKQVLADTFESSKRDCSQDIGLGRHVKRIVLAQLQNNNPSQWHSRHWADEYTSRIVRCCPNLLALSRYYDISVKCDDDDDETMLEEGIQGLLERYENECCSIHDPPLPTMRRLDWSNGTAVDPWRPTISAVPSSVWSAEQLEVLSLAGDNYFWAPTELQALSSGGRGHILLPNLHTLRVGSLYAFGVPGVSNYMLVLPALRRIILDRGEALHRLIDCVVASSPASSSAQSKSSPNVPNVKALEVGTPHWRFSRSDYISTFIRHYPTAESLHYPVFFARPLRWRRLRDNGLSYGPVEQQRVFSSLRHVGLHAEPNPELTYPERNGDAIWAHLHAHARSLLGSTSPTLLESRLPCVNSITLHGLSWISLINDKRFYFILSLARARGAKIQADNPSVANALEETMLSYCTALSYEHVHEL